MQIDNNLVEKAYKIILGRAKINTPINYSELYRQIGLDHEKPEDRIKGRYLLGLVNEKSEKDLLITSFVISKTGNGPFNGFYTLAEQMGRIKPGLSENEKIKFWAEEMNRVYNRLKK